MSLVELRQQVLSQPTSKTSPAKIEPTERKATRFMNDVVMESWGLVQMTENTPKTLRQRARALSTSLSPFRRQRKNNPPISKSAPLLKIGTGIFEIIDWRNTEKRQQHPHREQPHEQSQHSEKKNDMNGNTTTTWSYEEAARTVNPPPPSETKSKSTSSPRDKPTTATAMAVLTASRTSAGPLAVEPPPAPSNGAENTPWRTNPHATPNSKTSQYIDKITAENERLRRELKAERLAREDEAKRVSAAKVKAEDSRAEQQHLQVLADANARAIERKDRKIEELKAALEVESKRRQAAESRAEEALRLLGENRSQTQAQVAQAYEHMHRADRSALAAKDGYDRRIKAYEEMVKGMKKDIKELKRQRLEDEDRIKRQGIISEQLQHEVSRTLAREGAMKGLLDEYKKEKEKEVDELVQEAERMRKSLPDKEREAEELVRELREARDKMKWVMTQKRRQEEEGG